MKASRARGLFLVGVFLSWSAHAQEVAPGEGPPPDVLPTDSALPPPPADVPRADAQEQYDEQAIGLDDFGSVVTEHGRVTGTVQWTSPYQGKYKKPLVGADFYRAVGRDDLVKQYEDRGKRQLAEAYNRDLWQKLSSEPHADAVDVHVVPLVEKDGAGVSVAVRF